METVFAKDRSEWRRWLAKNFERSDEIWLVFYKKASGKPTVSYDHAVEEALFFGWIRVPSGAPMTNRPKAAPDKTTLKPSSSSPRTRR